MAYTNFVLTALLAVFQVSVVKSPVRLDGLDRLYFQRMGKPGAALNVPPHIASRLPKLLQEPDFSREPDRTEEFVVRDFRLPSGSWGRKLWLRQIVGFRHPRIFVLWWALYDHERRSDVWRFSPNPGETENKALSNYEIEDLSTAGEGSVVLLIRGSMRRPGGAWWEVGKVFAFSASEVGLTFSHVRNAFGFFSDYDRGGESSPITVSTEQESRGRFVESVFIAKQEEALRKCGLSDPLTHINPESSRQELERIALCITQRPDVKRSSRAFNQPSFVERGGKLQK